MKWHKINPIPGTNSGSTQYVFDPIVPLLRAFLFLSAILLAIVLLNGEFILAFAKEIGKLVALFFLLLKWLYFVACLTCVVRNFGLIYLLHALVFIISCAIPLSPYFLKHFCALLDCFCGANSSLLQVLSCAGLSRCHLLVFLNFPLQYFASFCASGFLHM